MTYQAPVADIAFALKNAAGFGPALAEGLYGDLADDLVEAVLTEAGKFATDILSPLNAIGPQRSPETRG
jgi:acyl-CoA dehydrogenase